jgi:hypothetical protein
MSKIAERCMHIPDQGGVSLSTLDRTSLLLMEANDTDIEERCSLEDRIAVYHSHCASCQRSC